MALTGVIFLIVKYRRIHKIALLIYCLESKYGIYIQDKNSMNGHSRGEIVTS